MLPQHPPKCALCDQAPPLVASSICCLGTLSTLSYAIHCKHSSRNTVIFGLFRKTVRHAATLRTEKFGPVRLFPFSTFSFFSIA